MSMYRRFEVIKKRYESDSVVSIYLKPADGFTLAEFNPGQHLMFKLSLPGQDIPVFRYYSFSDSYHPDHYRISVKKESFLVGDILNGGLGSSYIFDVLKEGDILEAKGPSGEFFIHPESNQPLVLIAGGIGITPLLSMMKSISKANANREVYFFYGVNDRGDHCFQQELNELKERHHNFNIYIFYTKVDKSDISGLHYDFEGFITLEIIAGLLQNPDVDHYICGPQGMMKYITGSLEKSGVELKKIHTESFNMDTANLAIEEKPIETGLVQERLTIEFKKSGTKLDWDPRYKSILEFAEANDVNISSGCLFGDCGTCLTRIHEGEIKYQHQTMIQPSIGRCLPCSCVPISHLVLEA